MKFKLLLTVFGRSTTNSTMKIWTLFRLTRCDVGEMGKVAIGAHPFGTMFLYFITEWRDALCPQRT